MTKYLIGCLTLAAMLVMGCRSKIETRVADPAAAAKLSEKPAIQVTDRSPVVASPGDTVALTGSNFRPGMKLALADGLTVDAVVESDTKASFQVPADAPFGGAELTVTQDDVTQKISLVFTAGQTDYPIITDATTEICSGKKFYDATGTLREGSKDCTVDAGAKVCSSEGEVGCTTTAAVKATIVAALAAKVVVGASVAGVAGTYTPDFPAVANVLSTDTVNGSAGTLGNCVSAVSQSCYATGTYYASTMCGSDGAVSCVVDNGTNYKAAASGVLLAGNIKRGSILGGVTGNYPSATSPLPRYSDDGATTGTTGVDETDLTSFATQVKAAGTFEFWDASGVRRTGSGDADIVAANIKDTVAFENLSITGTAAPALWDLRAGASFGSVTGKLKVNCRNAVNNTYYNYDGAVGSITDSGTTAGTAFDIWDTIDDYYGQPASTGFPAAWTVTSNYCGGVESVADDDKAWKDITTTAAMAPSTCTADAARYTSKDKSSWLERRRFQRSGTWITTIITGFSLTLNGTSQ